MSLCEISTVIEAFEENRISRMKEECARDYALAKLISYSVNDPEHFPTRSEVYPIFDDEEPEEDWRMVKAYMNSVAQARREAENRDDRRTEDNHIGK